MAGKIIDGVALANEVKQQIKSRVEALKARGKSVHLTAILVGSSPAAELYAKRQGDNASALGIEYELKTLPGDSTQDQVETIIRRLNDDPTVTGIMLHLPLPGHIDTTAMQNAITPVKDVEGVGAANLGHIVYGEPILVPCTALAAFELAKSTGVPMRGAEAVVVGASEIVGLPVAMLLSQQRATVTICRSATKDLAGHCRRAQFLIAAVGKAGLITADHVGDGAVVIDVGINRITLPDGKSKTVGDVDFDSAKEKAGHITPVPGGVGPMTVAILLQNTVRAAELLAG